MDLPHFKYYPDPIKTGSVKESDEPCECCEKARGYVYAGSPYCVEDLEDCICPWCIADGSAHKKFDAEFTDLAGIGGAPWDEVPESVRDEVAFRTPGFSGWQQERWWSHCGDAGVFLGYAGADEVRAYGHDLIEALKADIGLQGDDWEAFCRALGTDIPPTAYVFRCRHCGKLGGYQDST